jgi:AraC-like DNA-binding protein
MREVALIALLLGI